MNAGSQFLPPRHAVIFGITRRMLDQTAQCVRKFAMRVAECYFEQTAVDQRHVKFRWGVTIDELCKAERHNAQVLGRYMDGTVKVFPADLEDAWVSALPAPYRAELERELAARRGHLAVLIPVGVAADAVAVAQRMTKDFSELLGATAPILEDGVMNQADRPQLKRMVGEIDDMTANLASVRVLATDLLAAPASEAEKRGR